MEKFPFLQSKKFKYIIGSIVVLVVLLLTFQAGVMFGYHRARFHNRWDDHYGQNFIGEFNNRNFMKSNGAFGDILKIENSTITVKGRNEAEKNILVDKNTQFESGDTNIKLENLKVGDQILVIGSPNEAGQVQAKIVRLIPSKINNQK